jgi:hypothetical protein
LYLDYLKLFSISILGFSVYATYFPIIRFNNGRIHSMKTLRVLFVAFLLLLHLSQSAYAVVDPLGVPNNQFGIHIITPSADEIDPSKELVNSSGGDWGYITLLIKSDERDHDKWQQLFDQLREKHLIPLIRIATTPEGDYWRRPTDQDAVDWANFLDSLVWPTKNRYVIIYNEPNQGKEWGNSVDAPSYAKALSATITALKAKSQDFFVLNAGLDASSPEKYPLYQDESTYLKDMAVAEPGIFNRLDGWVSHSYPNPDFAGSPNASGKGTVRTWAWELSYLRQLGLTANLPIFITETGWKHAEGAALESRYPRAATVGQYYQTAFSEAWNNPRIVAVTPFVLSYQHPPFDHFSFKKIGGSEFYPPFETIKSITKSAGRPVQEYKAQFVDTTIPAALVTGVTYQIPVKVKNTGQSIWGEYEPISLTVTDPTNPFRIVPVQIPEGSRVKPGDTYTFTITLKTPVSGVATSALQLFRGNQSFESEAFSFTSEAKAPVRLKIKTTLKWKTDYSGDYILTIKGFPKDTTIPVTLNQNGDSDIINTPFLLPDYPFELTLERPYYYPQTVKATLPSGETLVDFGTLQPNLRSALLNPGMLIKLLPLSQ